MASTGDTWRLGHRPALDGIRGIAVLLVVACHSLPVLAAAGSVGVTMFFTLSGFLITTLLVAELDRTGRVELGRFFMHRALRLLPALLAAASVFAVLWYGGGQSLREVARGVLPAIFYVQNWVSLSNDALGPLGHTWSLAIEEQFYLVWPLVVIAAAALRSRRLLLWAAVVGSAYAVVARLLLWDGGAGELRVYMGSDTHADGLLVGCALALLMRGRPVRTSSSLGAALAVVSLLVAGLLGDGFARYVGATTFVPLATAALIWCAVRGADVGWLAVRPLVRVGRVSYGLYLWHYPMLFYVRYALVPAFGEWGSLLVALALSALLTWLSWRFVEQPFHRLRKRLDSPHAEPGERVRSGLVVRAGR